MDLSDNESFSSLDESRDLLDNSGVEERLEPWLEFLPVVVLALLLILAERNENWTRNVFVKHFAPNFMLVYAKCKNWKGA